jgi:signal transduction histidine kinase
MFRSIRSRLVLSFVGILLVGVLVHGLSLVILENFFSSQRFNSLRENAVSLEVLASGIAVLLAAIVGWFISRLIFAPVQALMNITASRAKVGSSSRINVNHLDEFEQLEHSFNEMADQVETTAAIVRRFVADAAHELHTPLTALHMNLDLALNENNVEDRARFLFRAQAIVKGLEGLNTKLLELARLEANEPATRDEIIDLTALLRQRIEIYASQAEQAELLFEVELPNTSVFIRGDANQITRAMDYLVDNACKFTLQDGTVRIALSQKEEQAVFSVIDTGIGVPADDLSQLFHRFHRGRNARAYPGSGLGLAIVKLIATTHAGHVEVQSLGEGKGSRFAIKFPAVSSQNP